MKERIVVIQGHPDSEGEHLCHGLAEAYREAAIEAGYDVRSVNVGALDFPLISSKAEWDTADLPQALQEAQTDMLWAEHWALFYPLWLGDMPAKLKGFLEQTLRPGLSLNETEPGLIWDQLLVGRSARIVVTMSMLASVYRLYYGAHSVKSLERNILKFCGIDPIKTTFIGDVYQASPEKIRQHIEKTAQYGARGE